MCSMGHEIDKSRSCKVEFNGNICVSRALLRVWSEESSQIVLQICAYERIRVCLYMSLFIFRLCSIVGVDVCARACVKTKGKKGSRQLGCVPVLVVISKQLLSGWKTSSARRHGPLWFACHLDWRLSDTNGGSPSLSCLSFADWPRD